MALSDLFKKAPIQKPEPVVGDISGLFGGKKETRTPESRPEDSTPATTAKLSHGSMQFKEGKPYLALIGQTFDVWGIVDVVGDSRTHIAARNVPELIFKRTGEPVTDDIIAFERKLVLATTRVFHDLPRETAFEAIKALAEDLQFTVEEMKKQIENSVPDYEGDAKAWREFLRETEQDSKESWAEDLARFKDEELPQAAADYWEEQRDEYQALAEEAEAARVWALAKIRKQS